jgi:hypothetical protein
VGSKTASIIGAKNYRKTVMARQESCRCKEKKAFVLCDGF